MKIKIFGTINTQLIVDEKINLPSILTIGRDKSCTLSYPQFKLLSRCHATILKMIDATVPQYNLVDGCYHNGQIKSSTNGIIVNGAVTRAKILELGDEIVLINQNYQNRSEYLKILYGIDFEVDQYATNY